MVMSALQVQFQGAQFFDSFIKGTALLYRKTPSKPTCVTENPKASA